MSQNHPFKQYYPAIICGCIALLLSWYFTLSIKGKEKQIPVYVATRNISAPTIILATDFQQQVFPARTIPDSAVKNINQFLNKTLNHSVSKGQMLTTNEISTLSASSEGVKYKNTVRVFSLQSSWLAGSLPLIQPNDKITIIAAGPVKDSSTNTFIIARHVTVLGVLNASDATKTILLDFTEEQSTTLLSFRANNYFIQVILEGQSN